MSQGNFAKNDFQNILEADNAQLGAVAAEDDGEAVAGVAHPAQGGFQAQVGLEEERGLEVFAGGFMFLETIAVRARKAR